jgi:hypothetical protein
VREGTGGWLDALAGCWGCVACCLVGCTVCCVVCSYRKPTPQTDPPRGRLNVLVHLLGKPLGALCSEMEGLQSQFKVGGALPAFCLPRLLPPLVSSSAVQTTQPTYSVTQPNPNNPPARRQVPPRPVRRPHRPPNPRLLRHRRALRGPQPQPPRGRLPGRAGNGAGRPGAPPRGGIAGRRRLGGRAARSHGVADPRGRRVCRAGARGGDAAAVGPAGLRDGGLRPRHHQQPGGWLWAGGWGGHCCSLACSSFSPGHLRLSRSMANRLYPPTVYTRHPPRSASPPSPATAAPPPTPPT